MSRMRLLNTMPKGETHFDGYCIVKSADVRQNINGKTFLDLVLTDCEGEGVAKLWGYNSDSKGVYHAGDIVRVHGRIQQFKDSEQLNIETIRETQDGEADLRLLIPSAPIDSEEVYNSLYTLAANFSNRDLSKIVTTLLEKHKDQLLIHPAAVKLHHATRSGLLHHTSTIIDMARGIVSSYPQLNFDLIAAGAILHDIGKLTEIQASELGIPSGYSAEGNLLGHITIDINEVACTAKELNADPEVAMLLEHMLLSHHGKPEFGSPKYPMFPEAEVLSELDLMDSRLYEMYSALDGIQPHGFTERLRALDDRQLYNHCFGAEIKDAGQNL